MAQTERRNSPQHPGREWRRELNEAPLDARGERERGREVTFARHPLLQPLTPILLDTDRKGDAIGGVDGTLNQRLRFVIRPD